MTLTRSEPLRRARMRTKHRDTGPDAATREALIARTNGRCTVCGQPGTDPQHRKPRQRGGTKDPAINRLSNLIWLCRGCHDWVETKERAKAYVAGLLVHQWEDPRLVPLRSLGGRVWLRDDGTVSTEPPEEVH